MISYSSEQFIFDRSIGGLALAFKLLLKLAVYSPLWFSGYMLATLLLKSDASAFAWIGLTTAFGFIILLVILSIKQFILKLMRDDNLIWVPLFLLCFGYTCIAPVWWSFDNIYDLMKVISAPYANLLTWTAAVVLVILLYSQYNFLSDIEQ